MPEFVLSATAIAWITAAIAITFGLIAKYVLTSFAAGIMFTFNNDFNEL